MSLCFMPLQFVQFVQFETVEYTRIFRRKSKRFPSLNILLFCILHLSNCNLEHNFFYLFFRIPQTNIFLKTQPQYSDEFLFLIKTSLSSMLDNL